MTDATTLPAPDLSPIAPGDDLWERERLAFLASLPSLLSTHRDLYVAIHQGGVIAEGPNKLDVARLAYERVGYVPIYVGLVSDRPAAPIRIPSPRAWFRTVGDVER